MTNSVKCYHQKTIFIYTRIWKRIERKRKAIREKRLQKAKSYMYSSRTLVDEHTCTSRQSSFETKNLINFVGNALRGVFTIDTRTL